MYKSARITLVQENPLPLAPGWEQQLDQQISAALTRYPDTDLLIFPELHCFGDGYPDQSRSEFLYAKAEPLTGQIVQRLCDLAAKHQIWLIPGSVCEAGPNGELYNTQILIEPAGKLAASYRKIFPWRPSEPYTPGTEFVVAPTPVGKLGLHICYDAWFPETTRNLAWLGAEIICNVVKTTTPDRTQELILAQANAIVNQVFVVSINVAAPTGEGQSIVVGPEGEILAQADKDPCLIHVELDLDRLTEVRTTGTAGTNRMWQQFKPTDPKIPLPLYQGVINPHTWNIGV